MGIIYKYELKKLLNNKIILITAGILCLVVIAWGIFNSVVSTNSKLDGVVRDFPSPGYLYIKRNDRGIYTYGTTKKADGSPKNPRYFYSSNKTDILNIDGVEYASVSEMQPKEYTRWSEDLNDDDYINERASSSPNSIMFRILRNSY